MLNLIDGERVPAASGAWLDVVEPATGRVHGGVARSGGDDVQRAVAAAERAFPAWAATPAEERSRLMLAVAARIEERLDELAAAESLDNGKPVALARRVDIPRAAANMRFFATAILHGHSELYESRGRALNVTLRQPHGVVGLISPWNLPLYLLTWKIAPAIAAGNTAVAKPSEITPLTADLLAEILQKTGLPPGVVNIVHGTGPEVGAPLVEHASVRAVSFTGSTRTGAEIARRTAGSFTKLSLEMGGKNPTLIFADADLERALPEAARAAFANQGQICLCGSRVIAEESVYERVLEALTRAAGALRVGDPRDEATEQGAVVSEAHRDKVLAAIERARAEGGRVVTGGGVPASLPERCRQGFFVEPTVIADLPEGCVTEREEIFGPVVSVRAARDEEHALALANATRYGLAASLWTRDLDRAQRVAERIAAGTLWVNCWMLRDLRVPFGGTRQSGLGREGGDEALRFFTEPKTVCISAPPSSAP